MFSAQVIYALQVVNIRSFDKRERDASSQKEKRSWFGIAFFTGKVVDEEENMENSGSVFRGERTKEK